MLFYYCLTVQLIVINFNCLTALVMGSFGNGSLCCRYLGYICDLIVEKPIQPHCKPLTIKSVSLSPVPCFNKQRNGCRPFCDILIGETRIFTTSQEYERMK